MLLLLLLTQTALAFSPNDISILLPLPKREEASQLWNPQTQDILLPRNVFDKLPEIVLDMEQNELYDGALKVVAIRIDPCFREGDGPCRHQIRLVWQPVVFEENQYTTLDAAIHTFYEVKDAEWEKLRAELPSMGASELGINPTLVKEGYNGPYWRKLQFLLRYCNPLTLVRATAMTVNPLGNIWVFSGINVVGTQLPAMNIPRTKDTIQGFFATVENSGSQEFRVGIDPAPAGADAFLRLLQSSRGAKKELTENEIIAATKESLSLQNPHLTNTGTVDCASCHTAHLIPAWAMRNFPQWDWQKTFGTELFEENGRKILPADHAQGPNVLRMFGYFGNEPVIAPRVRFETTLALKKM